MEADVSNWLFLQVEANYGDGIAVTDGITVTVHSTPFANLRGDAATAAAWDTTGTNAGALKRHGLIHLPATKKKSSLPGSEP
jgi:hypothetical protein